MSARDIEFEAESLQSFLESGNWLLKNIQWSTDEFGEYWTADLYAPGAKRRNAVTGTYYDINEDGKRDSRFYQQLLIDRSQRAYRRKWKQKKQ